MLNVFRIFREENGPEPAMHQCSLIAPKVLDKKPKYRVFIERRKSAVFWNRNLIFRKKYLFASQPWLILQTRDLFAQRVSLIWIAVGFFLRKDIFPELQSELGPECDCFSHNL